MSSTPRGGTAVMAGRVEPPDSLDYFPTPPWATRAVIEHVLIGSWGAHQLPGMSVWEPACGEGHMARPLAEYFRTVRYSDVFDYGVPPDGNGCPFLCDFLFPGQLPIRNPDLIIANPPFRLGLEFIERGLDVAKRGVAVLVRSAFLEGNERYKRLFSKRPPSVVAPFVERVLMTKGRLLDPDILHPVKDKKTGEIKMKKITTATAYSWLVWRVGDHSVLGPRTWWIPPCRKALTRPGDYAEVRR